MNWAQGSSLCLVLRFGVMITVCHFVATIKTVHDKSADKFMMFGGVNDSNYFTRISAYTPSTDQWTSKEIY